MAKALLIIAQRNFNETEYSTTKSVLESNKIKTITASISKSEAVGMKGMKVNPDKTVAEALKEEYDAVVIIGGSGSPTLADYPEVIQIIKKHNEAGKVLAAICLGPAILSKAGVLKNVMATVFPTDWSVSMLTREGAHYFDKNVVVDGKIVTANGPQAAKEFAQAISKLLS